MHSPSFLLFIEYGNLRVSQLQHGTCDVPRAELVSRPSSASIVKSILTRLNFEALSTRPTLLPSVVENPADPDSEPSPRGISAELLSRILLLSTADELSDSVRHGQDA